MISETDKTSGAYWRGGIRWACGMVALRISRAFLHLCYGLAYGWWGRVHLEAWPCDKNDKPVYRHYELRRPH